jgi:hypothetical protein
MGKPAAIYWNAAATFAEFRYSRDYIRFSGAGLPYPYAALLHELGHTVPVSNVGYREVLRLEERQPSTMCRPLVPDTAGIAHEHVATRWCRYTANGLWGARSPEACHIARLDRRVGYYVAPPKGRHIEPVPRPTQEQLEQARLRHRRFVPGSTHANLD